MQMHENTGVRSRARPEPSIAEAETRQDPLASGLEPQALRLFWRLASVAEARKHSDPTR